MSATHLFLWAEDSERELNLELAEAFPGAEIEQVHAGLLQVASDMSFETRLPCLAFSRQFLPFARSVRGESIRIWASELAGNIIESLPENQSWILHIEPHYGIRSTPRAGARAWHSSMKHGGKDPHHSLENTQKHGAPEAGRHRCKLIRESVIETLRNKRRHLLRQLRGDSDPALQTDSLVQVLLTSPEEGFVSIANAPLPYTQRHLLSRFPKGEVPIAVDKAAPSRAFAKLIEAESRMSRSIHSGEFCVDLGAAPGSWSYIAARRGARVTAVDRAPLREDLLRDARISFVEGDAFRYHPTQRVDWLLCDVIATPDHTVDLLLHWLREGWCKQFVVTIKLKAVPGADPLALLKNETPALTSEFFLTRLSANKKEVCAFGWGRGF